MQVYLASYLMFITKKNYDKLIDRLDYLEKMEPFGPAWVSKEELEDVLGQMGWDYDTISEHSSVVKKTIKCPKCEQVIKRYAL